MRGPAGHRNEALPQLVSNGHVTPCKERWGIIERSAFPVVHILVIQLGRFAKDHTRSWRVLESPKEGRCFLRYSTLWPHKEIASATGG